MLIKNWSLGISSALRSKSMVNWLCFIQTYNPLGWIRYISYPFKPSSYCTYSLNPLYYFHELNFSQLWFDKWWCHDEWAVNTTIIVYNFSYIRLCLYIIIVKYNSQICLFSNAFLSSEFSKFRVESGPFGNWVHEKCYLSLI